MRQWVDHLGADVFRDIVAAAPASPDRMTLALEVGLGKQDGDRTEHELWLMRHHVPNLGEVMTNVLQAASGPKEP